MTMISDRAQWPTTWLLILSIVTMLAGVSVIAAPHVSRPDVRVLIAFLLLVTSCLNTFLGGLTRSIATMSLRRVTP